MNIAGLIVSIMIETGLSVANTESKSYQATEYTVTQVLSTRSMFLIELGHQKYICKSLTPCFGLYNGEKALFTKNPEFYGGNKIYYMSNSECRISSCERIF